MIFSICLFIFINCGKKPDPEQHQKSISEKAYDQEVENQRKNSDYYVPKGELFRYGTEEYYNIIKTIKMTPEQSKEIFKIHLAKEYVIYKKVMEEFKAEEIKTKEEWVKSRLAEFKLLGFQDSMYIYSSVNEIKETDKLNIRTRYRLIFENFGVNIENGQVLKLKIEKIITPIDQ